MRVNLHPATCDFLCERHFPRIQELSCSGPHSVLADAAAGCEEPNEPRTRSSHLLRNIHEFGMYC